MSEEAPAAQPETTTEEQPPAEAEAPKVKQ